MSLPQKRKNQFCFDIQWKPLNVITLGWIETENFKQMIIITVCFLCYNEK